MKTNISRVRKRKFATTKAFSLIELLVVIAIIGVLATAATPYVRKMLNRGRAAKMVNNIRLLANAKSAYYTLNPTAPEAAATAPILSYVEILGQPVTSLDQLVAGTGFDSITIGNADTYPVPVVEGNDDLQTAYNELIQTPTPQL